MDLPIFLKKNDFHPLKFLIYANTDDSVFLTHPMIQATSNEKDLPLSVPPGSSINSALMLILMRSPGASSHRYTVFLRVRYSVQVLRISISTVIL